MKKFTVEVTFTAEVEVELSDAIADSVENFSQYIFKITDASDIAKHCARVAALGGPGEYDGLGRIAQKGAFKSDGADCLYTVLSEDVETEVLK